MHTKEQDYIKLPGKGFKRGSFLSLSGIRASLWLGRDHLLCIYNKGYEEDYKRFYFRDIQAFIIHQDKRRLLWNIAFGICALVFAFGGLTFSAVSAFFVILMFINWLRGPTCTCSVQTAVSSENLPSLNRVKNVNHAISRMSHVIEREQGHLSQEELNHYLEERNKNSSDGAVDSGIQGRMRAPGTTQGSPVKPYNGIIHKALFCVLVLSGILTSIDFFHKSVMVTTFQMIWSSGLGVLLIIALVKQQGSGLNPWTRRLTWTTLGFMCAVSFIIYFIVIFLTFQSRTTIYTTWDYIKMLSSVSPYDNTFLMVVYVISISYCVTAGITGLAFMGGYKKIN
jgi:hypothetical protein